MRPTRTLLAALLCLLLLPTAVAQAPHQETPILVVYLEPVDAPLVHGSTVTIHGVLRFVSGPSAYLQIQGIQVDLRVIERPVWAITDLDIETIIFTPDPARGINFDDRRAFTLTVRMSDVPTEEGLAGDIVVRADSRPTTFLRSTSAEAGVVLGTAGGCHLAPASDDPPMGGGPEPAEAAPPQENVTVQAVGATSTTPTPWIGAGALAVAGAGVGLAMHRRRT